MCHVVSRFIEEYIWRLLVNLPPQHLKSFVCTICLSAFLLLKNVIAFGFSWWPITTPLPKRWRAEFETSCNQSGIVRPVRHESRRGHARANDFGTTAGGGVFAVGAMGSVTGRTADVIIYDDPHEIGDWQQFAQADGSSR